MAADQLIVAFVGDVFPGVRIDARQLLSLIDACQHCTRPKLPDVLVQPPRDETEVWFTVIVDPLPQPLGASAVPCVDGTDPKK